jgi:hypothetical protein
VGPESEEDCSGGDDLEKTHVDFSHAAATASMMMPRNGSSVKDSEWIADSGAG